MKTAKCYFYGCQKYGVNRVKMTINTPMLNKLEMEFKGCNDHFVKAWQNDFTPMVDKCLERKESVE